MQVGFTSTSVVACVRYVNNVHVVVTTDIEAARCLGEKLSSNVCSHLQSINFSSYQVLQMIAINLFGVYHAKRRLDKMAALQEADAPASVTSAVDADGDKTKVAAAGDAVETDANLSADEKQSFDIIMDLTRETHSTLASNLSIPV